MLKNRQLATLLWAGALLASSATVTQVAAGETEDNISKSLTEAIPGLIVDDVQPSEAKGLYEVSSSNGGTLYVTEDGQYLFTGDMLQVTPGGVANLSEKKRLDQRVDAMSEYGEEAAITYPAQGDEKASIAVFTDIDCPYCRKFHNEVPELNKLGITVRYYGFPRSGPNTPSFAKYVSVWCSEDQQAAMNDAKNGRGIESKSCENPVAEQYNLGRKIGVTGTPASVLENGQIVPGYRPAEKMAEALGLL